MGFNIDKIIIAVKDWRQVRFLLQDMITYRFDI